MRSAEGGTTTDRAEAEKRWVAGSSVAALGVAGIAILVSVRLGRKAVDDLLDAAPHGLLERVAHAAAIPHVVSVSQVRVRQSGPRIFADVVLEVERGLTIDRAHDIAHAAEDAIRGAVPEADVVVHSEPAAPQHGDPGAPAASTG